MVLENKNSFDERNGRQFEPCERMDTLIKSADPTNCDISQIHRLCVLAAGSVIITICKSLTFIKFSCLHFGQNRGKFCSIVSFRILSRVLPPQTGHLIHSAVLESMCYLLQISVHNCLFFYS